MKNLRPAFALLLLLLLLPTDARAARYADVPERHWASAAIERSSHLALIGGLGDGRFAPERPVTRAEYATMLCRLMGWEPVTPAQGSFDDNQNPQKWYYSAIETAYAHGALRKLGANAGVLDVLTREELAVMTVRALGYTTLAGMVQDDCPFADVSTNRGYITLAYRMGFMGGTGGGAFRPGLAADRAQAATVMLRVYDAQRGYIAQLEAEEPPAGAVTVTPLNERGGALPMCPRAPLAEVYRSCVAAGRAGAVALHTAALDCVTSRLLTPQELDAALRGGEVPVYRSTRHESSYAVLDKTVVWFEGPADIEAKIALCRLMGVGAVYLVP